MAKIIFTFPLLLVQVMNAFSSDWLLGSGDDSSRRADNNKRNVTVLLFQHSLSNNFRESKHVQVFVCYQPIFLKKNG